MFSNTFVGGGSSGGGGASHFCQVYNSTDKIVANNTFPVVFNFDSEFFDTDNYHDNVVNNDRITIPAGLDGLYFILGRIRFSTNASGIREVEIVKNGTLVTDIIGINTQGANPLPSLTTVTAVTVDYLNVGDWISLLGFQNCGVGLNTQGTNLKYSNGLLIYYLGK